MAKIDVYKDWLKIEATNRPLNYYQLLKFNNFVDDPKLIRERYRQLNAYVRKFATGDYIEESQALLNELAKAMLCLTDAERKAEYDHSLGRKVKGKEETDSYGRRTLETILRDDGIASPDQIKKAKNYADALGVDLHEALMQQKIAEPEKIMLAYAESIGVPFVSLDDVPVDEYYAPQINPVTARQNSFVPIMSDMGKLIVASPKPLSIDVEDELRMLFETQVSYAICTPQQVNAAIAKYYPRDAVQKIVKRTSEDEKSDVVEKKSKQKVAKAGKVYTKAAKKNRVKLALVCFNFGFMLGAFGVYLGIKHAALFKIIGAGVILGAIAASCAWLLAPASMPEDE
ncbi:MAG: hypothetical protein IJL92_10515 [Thermoguttaceae bacterium]|nr:hypothetical protein [Thermoguttaceae bacterium]